MTLARAERSYLEHNQIVSEKDVTTKDLVILEQIDGHTKQVIAIIDKSGDIRSFGTRLVDAVCNNNGADDLNALVMIADMIVRKTDTGVKVNG